MELKDFPKITIIMRDYSYEESKTVLEAMKGLESNFAVEVTMNTDDAINIIKKLNQKFGNKILIGAGTVLTFEQEIQAIDSGAKFVLSACTFTKDMVSYAHHKGVIAVPGVMSVSEVFEMQKLGSDIIKIFPATIVGTKFFKDIQGPLGKLNLMAVGGISKENIRKFLSFGASYIGIGSNAFDKDDLKNQNVKKLRHSLMKLLEETTSGGELY